MSVYCCKAMQSIKQKKGNQLFEKSQNSHDFEEKQTKQFKIKENKAKRKTTNTHTIELQLESTVYSLSVCAQITLRHTDSSLN